MPILYGFLGLFFILLLTGILYGIYWCRRKGERLADVHKHSSYSTHFVIKNNEENAKQMNI